MTNYNLIEIIYISSENNIIRHNIRVKEDWKLSDLIDHMVSSSIFTEEFLSDKYYGCFGTKIDFSYVINENDRIEIFNNLRMSPNEKRKFNFKKAK